MERTQSLARWEAEGGSMPLTPSGSDYLPCMPPLPPGYEAQPVSGFHDETGRFSYEFNHVYGPQDQHDKRGPTCRLDEALSYWGVTWSTLGETGDERPAGRWVSYAQARKLRGSRLTFARFSSQRMLDELPELLHPAGV